MSNKPQSHEHKEIAGTSGKTAYEAYGENRNWKTYDDKPMPQWKDLKPEIQHAWAAAACATIDAWEAYMHPDDE